MQVELNQIGRGGYDLLVAGSGPAGIIVTLEFARINPTKRVLLIDYGRSNQPERNLLDDSIVITNPVNHHDPYECTNKGLGGSSATWGGRCVMYDRADFIPRPVVGENCTWSVRLYEECLAYVPAAQKYFQSGTGPFDLADGSAKPKPLAEGFCSSRVSDTVLERWSLPTRFGREYAEALKKAPNIDLLLGVELLPLSAPADGNKVTTATLRDVRTAATATVAVDSIVVATGAQEATRLLLRSPKLFERLGRPPVALGRYYQGHISGKIASVQFRGAPSETEYGFRREPDGTYQRRRFQFAQDTLVECNLLNTAFWLDNPLYFDPNHRSGAMSFMYLAMLMPILGRKLAPPAVAHSITKGKVNRIGSHLANIMRGLPGSLWTPASIFARRYCLRRKLPGVFLYSSENRYALHFHAEQIPEWENRMELAADGSSLVIHYRVTERDADEVIRAHELLDAELRACRCGELHYWFPPEERRAAIQSMSKDGVHQSGTTRIGENPDRGVVDENLRVWGTSNVYVCSSSVFPTSGQANPTFYLGVFAVRLAKYLARK